MIGFNKITVVGNCGKDPVLSYTKKGQAVLKVTVCENISDEIAQIHRVVFFGQYAENMAKKLKKGVTVFIEGHLKQEYFVDDTSGIEKAVVEILVNEARILSAEAVKRLESVEGCVLI